MNQRKDNPEKIFAVSAQAPGLQPEVTCSCARNLMREQSIQNQGRG